MEKEIVTCDEAFKAWVTGEYNILSPKEKQIVKNAFKEGWDRALMISIILTLGNKGKE